MTTEAGLHATPVVPPGSRSRLDNIWMQDPSAGHNLQQAARVAFKELGFGLSRPTDTTVRGARDALFSRAKSMGPIFDQASLYLSGYSASTADLVNVDRVVNFTRHRLALRSITTPARQLKLAMVSGVPVIDSTVATGPAAVAVMRGGSSDGFMNGAPGVTVVTTFKVNSIHATEPTTPCGLGWNSAGDRRLRIGIRPGGKFGVSLHKGIGGNTEKVFPSTMDAALIWYVVSFQHNALQDTLRLCVNGTPILTLANACGDNRPYVWDIVAVTLGGLTGSIRADAMQSDIVMFPKDIGNTDTDALSAWMRSVNSQVP